MYVYVYIYVHIHIEMYVPVDTYFYAAAQASLTALDLGSNGLGDSGGLAAAAALTTAGLRELHLDPGREGGFWKLRDQMNRNIGAIYQILLRYQYGIWTIDLLRVIWSLRKRVCTCLQIDGSIDQSVNRY